LVKSLRKNRRWKWISADTFLHLLQHLWFTINLLRRHRGSYWRRLILFEVAIAASLSLVLIQYQQIDAQASQILPEQQEFPLATAELSSYPVANQDITPPAPSSSFPIPQVHPLPSSLAQWQNATDTSDYFSEVKPTPIGYLIWSEFPIKIYVERPKNSAESPSSLQRFQQWVDAVLQGVREWSSYLPVVVVERSEGADISILRSHPSIRTSIDRETGKFTSLRARAAETRYEFYLRPAVNASQTVLSHRFTIQLSPDQTLDYTLATARHELGHALGIWGHSPLQTDTMYFSQVRNPPPISVRDINTLKRIYEQPTRLGWFLASQSGGKE